MKKNIIPLIHLSTFPAHFILIALLAGGLMLNSFCFSQNAKIDSLLGLLKYDKADTNNLIHLFNLSSEYKDVDNYQEGLNYGKKALELANIILNRAATAKEERILLAAQKYKAKAYNTIGNIYDDEGNYEEALKNHFAALKIRSAINDKQGIAGSYGNIGNIYDYQGNYPEALKNHFFSLKMYESIGDKKGIATSYGNIGIIYSNQGNYPDALKNYFASLKIEEEIGDQKLMAASYNNIGLLYCNQGNFSEAIKNHLTSLKIREATGDKRGISYSYGNIGDVNFSQGDFQEALKNYTFSLKIREAIGDKAGIAGSYGNIGLVYNALSNYPEALKNFMISLKISKEIGNKAGIAESYGNIGNVFIKQKKYNEAGEYLSKAKELAIEIGYKACLIEAYNALSELGNTKGDYKGAYENLKLYMLYRDSLDNEETRKRTIQSQMTFDFEKKEAIAGAEHKKEVENLQTLAEEKSRKQKIVLSFVLGSLLLVIVFAGFIFRSLRITRKQKNIIELQKKMVEQQKQEVEHQKLLVEEHQKEIIGSITYAKRLQQAILPSDEEIKKYLPDSFIFYKPKDIVAGDFYWMHYTPSHSGIAGDGLLFIAVADSTGHGVPGAMVSVVCSNALNRAVNEFNLIDTGKILDKTRELVLETFAKSGDEIKDGMDISLLAINKKMKQISWSGANNPLWYIQKNNLIVIKPDKQSIGKTDDEKPFTTHSIELNSGDVFYLMTDGYADQYGGGKGKKFKYKQLQERLINSKNVSLEEQKLELSQSFDEWRGNLGQVDDVTIIGIRM